MFMHTNFCTTSAMKQNCKNSDISNRLNTPVCHWSTKHIVPPPNKRHWPNVFCLGWWGLKRNNVLHHSVYFLVAGIDN